jgi:hypothetical protein
MLERTPGRSLASMTKDQINALHQRFLHDVLMVSTDLDACWYWRGPSSSGYGRFHHQGKMWSAHHVSYMLFKGPIPKRMHVLHNCSVKKCVNPDHLRADTHQSNMDDKVALGRQARPRGMLSGATRLTDQEASEILWLTLNCPWLVHRQIGERYRTSGSVVKSIKYRRTWAHVSPTKPADFPWKTSGSFKRRI